MTRPLALAGFGALGALLAALYLLPQNIWPALAPVLLLLAAAALAWGALRRRRPSAAFVVMLAAGLALLRLLWQQQSMQPVLALADDTPHAIVGDVYEVGSGLYDGVYSLRLRIDTLDDAPCTPFYAVCYNGEYTDVGARVSMQVTFSQYTGSYRLGQYGRGNYLRAMQVHGDRMQFHGTGRGLLLWAARLRNALGGQFLSLGRTVGGVAAAMIVGDKGHMDAGMQRRFRDVGLSHILVVSGLHLSLVATGLAAVTRRLLRRRTLVAVVSIAGILGYMLLVGMTVSVVRAGTLAILALTAPLFGRAADTLTSLGAALLALLLLNPYASCDMGLLLSFAATLGVWSFGRLDAAHLRLSEKRLPGRVLQMLGVTTFATLFTLPVLILSGGATVGPAMLLANLLCVPLLVPVMVMGALFVISHLVLGTARLLVTGRVLYGLIRLLEIIATYAVRWLPWRLGLSGPLAALTVILAITAAAILYHSRLRRFFLAAGLGLMALACGAYALLNAGTVQLALVGGGINPTVVVSRGGDSVVLYRGGRDGLDEVEEYLLTHGLGAPVQVVDMTGAGEGALVTAFGRVDVDLPEQVTYTTQAEYLPGVHFSFVRQKTGALCYIEVAGLTVGLNAGPVDCSEYPACSIFLAGRSRPSGLRAQTLVHASAKGTPPVWLTEVTAGEVHIGDAPVVWLRPGVSVRLRDVWLWTPIENADGQSAAA